MSAFGGAGQFVFGYGSLAAGLHGRRARLEGHRRVWGVAMDNRVDIPGYKSYRRAGDGSRPEVHVAFLDIVADPGGATDGIVFAVDEAALRALDERERNYDRVDVTAQVADAPGSVWTYRGSAAGRARLQLGLQRGDAVVDRAYLAAVRATFAALGIDDDVEPGDGLRLMELERLELPRADVSPTRGTKRGPAGGRYSSA